MKFCVLKSGSRGNSVYIEYNNKAVLIDAGLSYKELLSLLELANLDVDLIKAILITHEHSDHVKGVGVISRKLKVPVYTNQSTFTKISSYKPYDKFIFNTGQVFDVADFRVFPFLSLHDAVEPVGFRIEAKGSGKVAAICADVGQISRAINFFLNNVDLLAIETNHDETMLLNGSYPLSLKQRILSKFGHLSNKAAANFLKTVSNTRLKHIFLMHISEENNNKTLALNTVKQHLKHHANRLEIHLTYPDKTSKVVELV